MEIKDETHEVPVRQIVAPGELLSEDPTFLPGRGVIKTDRGIISLFVGLKEIRGKYINVVPLHGLYNPQVGDKIIGRIIDRTPVKWLVDINSKYLGTLKPQDAVRRTGSRNYERRMGNYSTGPQNPLEFFKMGDMVICKIMSGNRLQEPELTALGEDLGKINTGIVITISPPKIPRVIGKKGSMISLLKNLLKCKIFVAQNGRIWLQAKNFEYERLLIDAIRKIEREAHTVGLTDRIHEYIEKEKVIRGLK